jgi:O-glycosyl hydrolase
VTIKNVPKQKITSFGASGAWWPNDLIHFPEHQQKHLTRLLFSKHGLHLSSYRYNMGGDGGSDRKQVMTPGSRVESFLKTDGTYDFSRDHAGVTFLKKAQYHMVPYITFFINAAPSHIADNGQACGWGLTEPKIPAFADYIQKVLSYWTTKGIKIKYISPMNEPDNLRADCGQEGMTVNMTLRTSVFQAIKYAQHGTASSAVDIIGDETSQVTTQAFKEDPAWLASSTPYLSNIAVHNYDYPSDGSLAAYYKQTLTLTNNKPPPIKFTETCCSINAGSGSGVFGQQYDPTMVNALIVARYVWQYLTIVNAESFDWWTAVTNLPCSPKDNPSCATAVNNTAGYNSGLFYIDGDYNRTQDFTIYTTKRAYAVKHFSYFIRPGSVRYHVTTQLPAGVEALATVDSAQGNTKPLWNVLFLNNQTSTQDVTVHLPGKNGHVSNAVKTDPANDWTKITPLPGVNADGRSVDLTLPAQSMFSMQFTAEV